MGVDDMEEALELGFVETSGKKTDSTSVRFTHEALIAIDTLSAMDDIKRSEWIRDAAIEKLLKLKRQHEYLSKAFGSATYSLNTSGTQNKSPSGATDEPIVQNTLEGKEQ
jgi:hypothetical protein